MRSSPDPCIAGCTPVPGDRGRGQDADRILSVVCRGRAVVRTDAGGGCRPGAAHAVGRPRPAGNLDESVDCAIGVRGPDGGPVGPTMRRRRPPGRPSGSTGARHRAGTGETGCGTTISGSSHVRMARAWQASTRRTARLAARPAGRRRGRLGIVRSEPGVGLEDAPSSLEQVHLAGGLPGHIDARLLQPQLADLQIPGYVVILRRDDPRLPASFRLDGPHVDAQIRAQ